MPASGPAATSRRRGSGTRIKANQDWIGIFHSADDPLIPVAEARFVAARLGASYFESADRGHFIDDRTFPEVVQFVRRKLGR